MKKYISIIIVVLVFVSICVAMRVASTSVLTEKAVYTTIENSVSAKGFIVRDETAYYARSGGTAYFNVEEGKRISRDSLVATVYKGDVKEETLKTLSMIDTKLFQAYSDAGKSILHKSDSGSIENDIHSRVSEIYGYADDNDIERISETRNAINSLRKYGEYNADAEIGKLEEQKRITEGAIGLAKDEIYTEISGVFSTYLDGLESVLQSERIEEYTPNYIKTLKVSEAEDTYGRRVETGTPICKVMNNHVWYTLVVINGSNAGECEEDKNVKLRFKNMANAEVEGTITYMSEPDENNDMAVLVRCSTYVESVFSYREADVDIIFESYTGYRVPTHAIRAYDNSKYKVVAQAGSQTFECAVNVLYTDSDGGYSIVESASDAANTLAKAERIVIGDNDEYSTKSGEG